MALVARSSEEIEYLNNLDTINFTICKTINGNKYYILIVESVSKFSPCYLNKNCEIVTSFNLEDYIESYDACIEIIKKRYEISARATTPYYYRSIEVQNE